MLLTLTGFFIGGPANMTSRSVSADLGETVTCSIFLPGRARELRGNAEALSTVTGIVDGEFCIGLSAQFKKPSVTGFVAFLIPAPATVSKFSAIC
ncbi:unnamed protein product [Heligmosomoides polygyrus]|uniref:Secreted protein n=1 Tax=Heligmosomoides polygyrus TaxID=6339 RepID=A0A183GG64_HELPZ|nr:unnamed protein product [Heligmosomoides polygyrus]